MSSEFNQFTRKKLLFIPFYASRQWSKNMKNVNTYKIKSYRNFKINQLKQSKNNYIVNFREGNTLTSTIYKFNNDDSFFLFFTDRNKILRPFFGFFNLLSGFVETLLGVFTMPFDKGNRFQKGVQGTFFSIPELLFFNIRKGSFQFLDSKEVKNYFDNYEH